MQLTLITMKNRILSTCLLIALLWGANPALYAIVKTEINDTTQSKNIKSFFLLRLNLETDPVDLQNYISTQNFRKQFQAFAGYYNEVLLKMDQEHANLLRWAISDAMNGNFDQSMQSFNKFLQLEAIRKDETIQPGIHQLIGLILEMKGDFPKAALEQQKALSLATANKNPAVAVNSLISLGRIKSKQKKYEEADTYLIKRALPAVTRLKDQKGIVACYREIGDRYNREELFSQSLWFYLQSLTLAQKINFHTGTIAALVEIGQLKYETGDFTPAIRDWQEAESLAITQHELPMLLKIKWGLAMALKQNDNLVAAEKYAMEFEQLKDVLLNPVL